MDEVKHHRKSSKKDSSDRKDKDKNGEKKERHRDRDSSRHHRHYRHHSKERERSVDEKPREKHRDRESKNKDGDNDQRSSREEERKEKVKEKGRDRDREKEKEREEKEKEREKERDRAEKEKEREKERERAKEKERESIREKEKRSREVERDGNSDDGKEHDRKRRRREDDHKERERERERSSRHKEEDESRRNKRGESVDIKENDDRTRERSSRHRDEDDESRRNKRGKSVDAKENDRTRERSTRHRDKDDESRRNKRGESADAKENDRTRERSRRHRDGDDESRRNKRGESMDAKGNDRTREEDLEEEQRKLDEEMDKRRRRVQEWQELKRKKEESERGGKQEEEENDDPKFGKKWTLEGESDDEEAVPLSKSDNEMDVDVNLKPVGDFMGTNDVTSLDVFMHDVNGAELHGVVVDSKDEITVENGGEGANGEDDIDPLDAFMNSMVLPEVEKLNNAEKTSKAVDDNSDPPKKLSKKDSQVNGDQQKKGRKKSLGRILQGEDSDSDYENHLSDGAAPEDENDDEFIKRVKKTKVEKLSLVDHSKIEYPDFRKDFYIEVKEISKMTSEEVVAYRKELELKLHGKDIPKPIKTWIQTGLTSRVLDTIKKLGYEKPMPIQAQALPIIMSGRDCIGVAKTGSGKTLAFVLPMLRHIKDQPLVIPGDGPIALIMAHTRELVQQIHSDIRKFAKVAGVTSVPVYGGSGVAQQISELKRGAEIVVCTPGRMIDILCTSNGKITNLRRVTYLVMDEADRMFDMGFEPQITRIVQNTRPDRQTVLFSATFPRQVEILARKVLTKPVEIQIGGRSVVNKDISQLVEVRPENERFLRLLELLGEWYEKGKILIFVHSQEKCDALFKDMLRHGYPCLSLHGAKDQTDRESTISDFKSNVCSVLIATSIAARGLDVKELELVINYDVPNHYEDYVHRVGRTGRAGRKGCAITFISEDDARYAPDLVKALQLSEQVVPDDLKALADGFMAKVNQGLEQAHGTGYGGSGFKFNEEEDEVTKAVKKAQARGYGFEEDKSDSDSEDDGIRKSGGGDLSQQVAAAHAAFKGSVAAVPPPVQYLPNGGVSTPGVIAPGGLSIPGKTVVLPTSANPPNDAAARAAALAAAINLQHSIAKIQADAMPEHYQAEFEINDFPQNARWKVTHKETLGPISEWTGAAITTRGQFYPPGKVPGQGDRKLYLSIEGPTESSVKKAKAEVKRVLEDITRQATSLPGASQPGKYSVL